MTNILKINYFTDPGHGWASVKLSILEDLGLIDQISHYSYINGKSAYLEEDCDMGRLFDACKAKGIQVQTFSKHTNNRSKIRSFDQYTPSRAKAAKQRPIAKGDRIEYGNAIYIVRESAGPRRGLFVNLENHGAVYRLPARALSQCVII